MRILVMGAGGVGGYYGAMLAHAGNDVTFVARGAHLAAVREKGLELRTQGRMIRIAPARAIAAVNPFRYLMRIVRGVMLKGIGFADAGRDLAFLAGLAAAYSGLAWLALRRVFRKS